ncbi:unnamed protein product [Heterobilharzia americana]|nr:unnamed protein product [Heterobilharzia americana]
MLLCYIFLGGITRYKLPFDNAYLDILLTLGSVQRGFQSVSTSRLGDKSSPSWGGILKRFSVSVLTLLDIRKKFCCMNKYKHVLTGSIIYANESHLQTSYTWI